MFYVLGEDAAHRSFIRAWLTAGGVSHHRFHLVDPPAGQSGGSHFVLTKCKETVRDARDRNQTRAKTRVIIAIDGDNGTVEDRLLEIRHAVESVGENDYLSLVCVLVPKRHIETWVHALGPATPQVNEQDDYKHKTTEEVKAAARRLARLQSAPLLPPSLAHGYAQFQRLKAK